jgi:hypothetical protein
MGKSAKSIIENHSRIIVSPVSGEGLGDFRNEMLLEYKTNDLLWPRRWSGMNIIKNDQYHDITLFGFVISKKHTNIKEHMLLICDIYHKSDNDIYRRDHWDSSKYDTKTILLLSSFTHCIKWSTYCEKSKTNGGTFYKSSKAPQGTCVYNISNDILLPQSAVDYDTNWALINWESMLVVNPPSVTQTRTLTKDRWEQIFKQLIDIEFAHVNFLHDKTLIMANGKRYRPDFHVIFMMKDGSNYVLHIEYDEKDHTSSNYSTKKERIRLNDIQSYFNAPMTVIRYGTLTGEWSNIYDVYAVIRTAVHTLSNATPPKDIGIKGQIIYIGYNNIQDQTSDDWNVIYGSELYE